jgi:OOP family OmpA-OmpF porin
MMRKTIVVWWLVGLVLGLVSGTGTARAELTNCSPKVDNFVLFVDQSGSMYQQHQDAKEVKEILVKRLLGQMNDQIPQIGYKGGLDLFAPFAPTVPVAPYSRAAMSTGIASIPDDQPVFWRMTPMGQGIGDLTGVVRGLSGKTAVIMFSDGEQNEGPDPIEAAKHIVHAHPDVCLHVVSFAESPYGVWLNHRISSVGQGCLYAEGTELLGDGAKLEQFVRDVFCGAKPKQKIILRGVNFDFDKATIKPEGKPVLDAAIQALKEQADVRISVDGHTDSVGTDAYNERLSERRAQAVVDYLAAGGIARDRMSARGFGESKPVASNDTADGRAQNRRVEFSILTK